MWWPFLPTITRPTRITTTSSTLIDNLFTNRRTKISEPVIVVDDTSDHLPILAWIDLKPFMINVPTASFYRRTDLAANNLFKQILASTNNWNSMETICAANDVSSAHDQFELMI